MADPRITPSSPATQGSYDHSRRDGSEGATTTTITHVTAAALEQQARAQQEGTRMTPSATLQDPPYPFDPDTLAPGMVAVSGHLRGVVHEGDEYYLEIDLPPDQYQACWANAFKSAPPAMQIAMEKEHNDRPPFTLRPLIEAMSQLAEEAQGEADAAWKNQGLSEEQIDEAENTQTKAEELVKSSEKLQAEAVQLQAKWKQLRKKLVKTLHLLLDANDANYEERSSNFFKVVAKMQTLNPKAIEPMVPMITCLSFFFNPKDFLSILDEAKKCHPQLTYAFFFTNYTGIISKAIQQKDERILAFLKSLFQQLHSLYRRDVVVPAIIEMIETHSTICTFDLSPIDGAMTNAMESLLCGKHEDAINILVDARPMLEGFAPIHRYLALAWTLRGEPAYGRKFLDRANQLLTLKSQRWYPSAAICKHLQRLWPQIKKVRFPTTPSNDPLEALITLVKGGEEIDLDRATHFIKVAIEDLRSSHKNFPIVYCGFRWMSERLVMRTEFHRPFWTALWELLAPIAALADPDDQWMKERFVRIEQDGAYHNVVNMSCIGFGPSPYNSPPLVIEFNHLELTAPSLQSVATSLTKQLYNLIIGVMSVGKIADPVAKGDSILLAHDRSIFLEILRAGFTQYDEQPNFLNPTKDTQDDEKPNLLNPAKEMLRLYTEAEEKPYAISSSVLEWGAFCVETLSPASINNQTKKSLNAALSFHISVKVKDSLLARAFRDVNQAISRFNDRQTIDKEMVTLPSDGESAYDAIHTAHRLFGWRLGESFETWGGRLQEASRNGIGAPQHNALNQKFLGFDSRSSVPSIQSQGPSEEVFKIMRAIRSFWTNFHTVVSEHNLNIHNGADDMGNNTQALWHKDVTEDEWKAICQQNDPTRHPKHYNQELSDLVEHKYTHFCEFKELREAYHTITQHYQNREACARLMATNLLVAAEYDRGSKAHHSIYVPDLEMATLVYQILLEVGFERILCHERITAGPGKWGLRNADELIACLKPSLSRLGEKFHGPETHPNGAGPLETHYNGQAVTLGLRIINTHIYYE